MFLEMELQPLDVGNPSPPPPAAAGAAASV